MEIKRLSTILKLIANPERMAILFLLLDGDRSITELAQTLDSSPTGIANHLTRLRTEGIIDFTRYHRIIEYRLISEEATTILNTLRTLKDQAETFAKFLSPNSRNLNTGFRLFLFRISTDSTQIPP